MLEKTKFLLNQAFLSFKRRRRLTIPLTFGITISFILIIGLSAASETYYRDTASAFDHYSKGLVIVQKGTPFINGLPVQSVITLEIVKEISDIEILGSWGELAWVPERNEESIIGDIILGIGNGSFGNPAYSFVTGLRIEKGGQFPSWDKHDVVIGKNTRAHRNYGFVGTEWDIRDLEFNVSGIISSVEVIPARYLMMSLNSFRNITTIKTHVNMIFATPIIGKSIEDLEIKIETEFPSLNALNQLERDRLLSSLIRSIREFTTYVSYLSAFASIVFTMIFSKLSIDLRRREFGILRALGARKGDTAFQFISEIGIIGLIGAFIGTIVGIILASVALFDVLNSVNLRDIWLTEIHILENMPWAWPFFTLIFIIFGGGGSMIYFANKAPIVSFFQD